MGQKNMNIRNIPERKSDSLRKEEQEEACRREYEEQEKTRRREHEEMMIQTYYNVKWIMQNREEPVNYLVVIVVSMIASGLTTLLLTHL